jgi:aspartyl-tRNA(Asn)/glutamyl-tRNA(Gln) amidotransferase subunit A
MFANYFGLPAISVPCGFDEHGLPIGLQMVGKPWDDGTILHLAHEYQTATALETKHPLPRTNDDTCECARSRYS